MAERKGTLGEAMFSGYFTIILRACAILSRLQRGGGGAMEGPDAPTETTGADLLWIPSLLGGPFPCRNRRYVRPQ